MFLVEFDYAHTKAIEIVANFVGPFVRFLQPIVDIGLLQTHFKKDFVLEIENPSDTEAEILLRNNADTDINFDSNFISIARALPSAPYTMPNRNL